eukprot:7345936-Prymnesium_polylepis.1
MFDEAIRIRQGLVAPGVAEIEAKLQEGKRIAMSAEAKPFSPSGAPSNARAPSRPAQKPGDEDTPMHTEAS